VSPTLNKVASKANYKVIHKAKIRYIRKKS